MATTNRTALLTKAHRVLKKHYTPITPPERTLLEHLLYACCLENAPYEKADEAYARLEEMYFDWNEVRVTTVSELSEVMKTLPDSAAAAQRLKKSLQRVFETYYSFDLEAMKKQNIGKAVKSLSKNRGVTPFVVAYITQNALGGHAIAIDQGTLDAMVILGIASEAEAAKKHVPGVERAISKRKGVEFASLLHQLGADYYASPFSTRIRTILLAIQPDAKDRFPKRQVKKAPAKPATKKKATTSKSAGKKTTATPKKAAKAKKKTTTRKKSTTGAKKKSPTKRLARKNPR